MKTLYTFVQSPFATHFSELYKAEGIVTEHFYSSRNLHRAIQKQAPDFFMGEFMYGWANDYAGNTVSNLDVTLRTLQAAAPKAKIIVVMQPSQEAHIGKLLEVFPIDTVLKYPIAEDQMRAVLQGAA